MRTAAALRLLLPGALVILTLTSCAATDEADLLGPWKDDAGITALRLQSGGRCQADALDTQQGPTTGSCRWRLKDEGWGTALSLDFTADPDAGVSVVSFEVGDHGARLSFVDHSDDITYALHR